MGEGEGEAGDAVARMWRAGAEAWPGLAVDLARFRAHVARHAGGGDAEGDPPAPLHPGDLYLACACAAGTPAALRAFEDQILPAVAPALRRLDPSAAFADEVRQILRARLFVAEEGALPKISDYAGRGPLATWVRVAAVRTALNLRAARQRESPASVSQIVALAPPIDDPGLRHLKERFADQFKVAITAACDKLADRDKTILRLRFVDGLNIDQIGALYAVHRATVARWIAKIRDDVFDGTRDELRSSLHLDDEEFDSLLRLAHSQLDLSISTVLGRA
jgi:RNA polymerase sigma-70 factor (ECF subfamily)